MKKKKISKRDEERLKYDESRNIGKSTSKYGKYKIVKEKVYICQHCGLENPVCDICEHLFEEKEFINCEPDGIHLCSKCKDWIIHPEKYIAKDNGDSRIKFKKIKKHGK